MFPFVFVGNFVALPARIMRERHARAARALFAGGNRPFASARSKIFAKKRVRERFPSVGRRSVFPRRGIWAANPSFLHFCRRQTHPWGVGRPAAARVMGSNEGVKKFDLELLKV
jgi:hypothetical protein